MSQKEVIMRTSITNKIFAIFTILTLASALHAQERFRRLPVKEYRDKMKAGWVGQMVGVAWGYPIEFRYYGRAVPECMVPKWSPDMVSEGFIQDDLYLDIGYLHSLDKRGLGITSRQVSIDFARYDFEYRRGGRSIYMQGLAPPDSGHPNFRGHPDGLGYQIAADVTGLIAPGLGNSVVSMGEKFARVSKYGDGIYAGVFVGAMYSEAFFENDPVKIVKAALQSIPSRSTFAEMVRDVLKWYEQNPEDWERCYELIDKKYFQNKEYNWMGWKWKGLESLNMDVKLNSAFIVTGLLYGKGGPEKTIIYSLRGGHDCDCNPSNSAGVLFTTMGFSKLEKRFTSIDERRVFSQTEYPLLFEYKLSDVVDLTEKIARQVIERAGGRIEKDEKGDEVFVIPIQEPKPGELQDSKNPGPIANSRFSEEELAEIRGLGPSAIKEFKRCAPGWEVKPSKSLGMLELVNGKKNVFVTYPADKNTPCILTRKVDIPADLHTNLRLKVGHDLRGGWTLIVKANGKEVYSWDVVKEPWVDIRVNLSDYAGQTVKLELVNKPSRFWANEWAYWKSFEIVSFSNPGKQEHDPYRYLPHPEWESESF
jgi:hypothetical protein